MAIENQPIAPVSLNEEKPKTDEEHNLASDNLRREEVLASYRTYSTLEKDPLFPSISISKIIISRMVAPIATANLFDSLFKTARLEGLL